VEFAYADEPIDRMAEGARRLAPKPPPAVVAAPRAAAGVRPASSGVDAQAAGLAREAAMAARDFAALEEAVAAFPWAKPGSRGPPVVFSRGAADAAVLVIGDKPGRDDEQAGRPFSGPAGRLADRMLTAAGLEGRALLTNTVFRRPRGDTEPSPAERALSRPFLERAIALVRPRILVLFGDVATRSLLATDEPMPRLRGRWFDWTPDGGGDPIPALPMLHPAFLLRQPVAKRQAWTDILTLLSRLDRPA